MNTLSAIGKVTGLNSTINALKKLPAISADLQGMDLTLFAQQMERVAAAMRPLASEMARVAAGFAAFPIRIQRLIAENDRLFNSNRRVGRSFGFLGSGLASVMGYYYSLKRIGSIFGKWVDQSTAYVENLNLFTVAMGEGADEAIKYAETVQEALGIDMSEFIKNQGVFKQVLSGFGVASDKANLMSKNLTQLGYDISSYFNISIESAMEKLQSGIAGQVRPLRDVGYAIEMATLQEVAYAHGINMSVSAMSQAQKSQLRYVAIMEQSNNAMGDMARTIMTPANALRIVGEQVKQLGRAIGDTLIPIIMTVLPYIQALIELLTEAFRALASFMGFEIPKIDYSGIEGIGGAGEDAENALDGATEAAKELKNATLGIDELNILSPAVDSGKGGMDGAFGDDLGLKLDGYDFLGNLRDQTNEIKEKLKPILQIVLTIAAAFALWKIGSALFGELGLLSTALAKIKGLAKAAGDLLGFYLGGRMGPLTENAAALANALKFIGVVAAIAAMVARFVDLYKNSEKFRKGLSAIGGLFKNIVTWITNTAIPAIGEFFINLIPEETKQTVLNFFSQFQDVIDALDLDLWDLAFTLGGIGLLFTPAAPIGAALLIFEGITIAIRSIGAASELAYTGLSDINGILVYVGIAAGVVGVAVGLAFGPIPGLIAAGVAAVVSFAAIMNTDAIPAVNIFGDDISDVTREKVEPFLEQIRALDDTLTTLEWTGQIIDDSVVADVQQKTAAIRETILNELSSDRNEALATLEPLKAALGDETYAEIIAQNQQYYDNVASQITRGEQRINQIMTQAGLDNRALTQQEWQDIAKIQTDMQDVGIHHLTETEIEYQAIMNRMKDNAAHVSLEQASEIIKNAQMARDETINAAELQYAKVELEAQRMLDVDAISTEAYQAIIDAAAAAKESTITDALEQYDTILSTTKDKLGETARYIDTETGEIKSKWSIFWEDISTAASNKLAEIQTGISNFGADISREWNAFLDKWNKYWSDTWEEIKASASGLWNDISTAFQSGWNNIVKFFTEAIPNWWNNTIAPWFTFEKWAELGKNAIDGLFGGIGNIFKKGADLGAQLLSGFRSKDGIDSHSPSKAFYDVGLDSIAGLQNGMAGITDVGASIGSGLVSTMVSGISESAPQIVTAAQSIADSVQKVFDGVTYDPLINYMELINAAKEAGDLASAAHYETIRNAKIAGEGITEYAPTYDFTEAFQPAAEELTKSNAFLGSLTDYSLKTNDMTATDMADWTARYNETNAWQTELMGNLHDWFSDWTNLYETLDNRMLTAISQGMARNASGLSALNSTNLNGFSSTLREIQTAANRIVASTEQIRIEVYYGSKLDGFASGGFPAQGQMFVAREAGPELVGTIGGRTAVANDGQIISGIREGVADANEQQNALLREQNELLREILSKTGTYINGKQVTNLVEKTQRERGASIMTGGVMFR